MDSKVPRDNDQLDKHSYINIDGDEKTGNYAKVVSDLYTSFKPISVSGESVTLSSETPTDILVAIDIANGTQVLDEDTLTESRNLVLTVTDANTSISAGTVTITGLDDFGNVITDVLDLTSALTLTTTNLYKSITSVVVEDLADEEAGDTIAIETGTAGLTGKFFIANRGPILSTYGETLGYYKDATHYDTSFKIATGTALTTPVWYDKRKDEAHILLDLGAGEYCIDHINGLVYYKTADDTATTIDYIYPMQKMDVAGVTFSGNVDVYAFKNEAGTQKDAKVNGADILVMQTGSGNDATTMNKEIATENTLGSIETEVTTELDPHYNPAADETPVALKAVAGKLHYVHVYNPNTYDVRVQLFNIAAASAVPGTTPIRVPLRVPAQGYGWIDLNTKCVGFDTAMSYAITKTDNTTALDTDAEITIFYR